MTEVYVTDVAVALEKSQRSDFGDAGRSGVAWKGPRVREIHWTTQRQTFACMRLGGAWPLFLGGDGRVAQVG